MRVSQWNDQGVSGRGYIGKYIVKLFLHTKNFPPHCLYPPRCKMNVAMSLCHILIRTDVTSIEDIKCYHHFLNYCIKQMSLLSHVSPVEF